MQLLNEISKAFPSQISNDFSHYWHLYFIRFLVILWFLIFPCIFGLLFLFFKEINRSKKTVILFTQLKPLMFYGYVFHNFLFFIVFLSITFNACFFLYTLVDVYLLELNDLYAWIWRIKIGEGPEPKEENFFFGIVSVGLILHLSSSIPYIYYNLYETDSYFGEAWRTYIVTKFKKNNILIWLENRNPVLYKKMHRIFLDVKIHDLKHDQKNIVVIDPERLGI